jgi:hypothetical protein
MRKISRRGAIVTAMKAGAYTAPAIVAASIAVPVAAVSPAPGTGTLTISPAGATTTMQGTGFPASNTFLIVGVTPALAASFFGFMPAVVTTNAAGAFTYTFPTHSGNPQGIFPATVNGGLIFFPFNPPA